MMQQGDDSNGSYWHHSVDVAASADADGTRTMRDETELQPDAPPSSGGLSTTMSFSEEIFPDDTGSTRIRMVSSEAEYSSCSMNNNMATGIHITASTTKTEEATDANNGSPTGDTTMDNHSSVPVLDSETLANLFQEEEDSLPLVEQHQEELPNTTTLKDVYHALQGAGSVENICGFGGGNPLQLPCLPGLHVEGVGLIPLPLTQETANRLKRIYSEGTLLNNNTTTETANDGFQVDPNLVTITNPQWKPCFQNVLGWALRRLAYSKPKEKESLKYKLCRLVLLEKGDAMNLDNKEGDGRFATLVVQLPSVFTGGACTVSYDGENAKTVSWASSYAPYTCHFAAHYADCKQESLPVESGLQLVLVYSLHIKDRKPTARQIVESGRRLSSSLSRLNMENSLFCVPLDHSYNVNTLRRLGAKALRGSDLAKARVISRVDGWVVLIGTMIKGETKSFYIGRVHGLSRKLTMILAQQLNCASVFDDGAVMATEEELKTALWKKYTDPKTKREGVFVNVLIAYSGRGAFERTCRLNFSGCIDSLEKQPALLERALGYLQRAKPTIAPASFMRLHAVMQSKYGDTESFWRFWNTIVQQLDSTVPPPADLCSLFCHYVETFGRCDKTEAIFAYMNRLTSIIGKTSTLQLLHSTEMFLRVAKTVKDEELVDNFVASTITDFKERTAGRMYLSSDQSEVIKVAQFLKKASRNLDWESASTIIEACFARMRKRCPWKGRYDDSVGEIDYMGSEIEALQGIRHAIKKKVAHNIRSSILVDFISLLEKRKKWESSLRSHILDAKDPRPAGALMLQLFLCSESVFKILEKWAVRWGNESFSKIACDFFCKMPLNGKAEKLTYSRLGRIARRSMANSMEHAAGGHRQP